LDVTPVRRRGGCQGAIVPGGQGETLWDCNLEAGYKNDKQQPGNWGGLWGLHGYWGEHLEGALKE